MDTVNKTFGLILLSQHFYFLKVLKNYSCLARNPVESSLVCRKHLESRVYDFTLGCLFLFNPRDSRGWVKDLRAVFERTWRSFTLEGQAKIRDYYLLYYFEHLRGFIGG